MNHLSPDFAPFNDNIDTNPDRDFIVGPYSTYDVKLACLANKKFVDKWPRLHQFLARLNLYKSNAFYHTRILYQASRHLSVERVLAYNNDIQDIFWHAICQNDIRQRLVKFDDLEQPERLILCQDIIDAMTIAVNKRGATMPRISVKFDAESPFYGFVSMTAPEITLSGKTNWKRPDWICNILVHEFKHLMDFFSPHKTPLGAQITVISMMHYTLNGFGYKTNPSEMNAYVGELDIEHMVQRIRKLPLSALIQKGRD